MWHGESSWNLLAYSVSSGNNEELSIPNCSLESIFPQLMFGFVPLGRMLCIFVPLCVCTWVHLST